MTCLTSARYGISWEFGAAEFVGYQLEYVLERKQFGVLTNYYKLADMQCEIASTATLRAEDWMKINQIMKWYLYWKETVGKALDIARTARDMHGGNGIWWISYY